MDQGRGTQPDRVEAQPDGATCPVCGHSIAKHEASPEDEFVASHGGVGYAFCLEIDPSGETADPCGCRTIIGSSREAHDLHSPGPDRSGAP